MDPMESPLKKKKLVESKSPSKSTSTSPRPTLTSKLGSTASKVQPKISSFFQKATTTIADPMEFPSTTSTPYAEHDASGSISNTTLNYSHNVEDSSTSNSILDAVEAFTAADGSDYDFAPMTQAPMALSLSTKASVKPASSSMSSAPTKSPTKPINPLASKIAAEKSKRASTLDAEEQRQLDKAEKAREKNSQKYAFLVDPLDEQRRPRSDPNYDPRTLFIPLNTYHSMTDFEKQYWDIKRKYFNYIIFFQKGIFYELMEGDADIAGPELGLFPMMRAGMRGCGFSIEDGHKHAEKLVSRGYSVVFVAQVETPTDRQRPRTNSTDLEEDDNSSSADTQSNPKKRKTPATATQEPEKMLRRVVDRILTPGTAPDAAADLPRPVFLLSLSMDLHSVPNGGPKYASFGVCLLNTSSGRSIVGQMNEDDCDGLTKLRTLLFHTRPKEILFEKNNLTKAVIQLLKLHGSDKVSMRQRVPSSCPELSAVHTAIDQAFPSNNEPLPLLEARSSELALKALGIAMNFLEETRNLESMMRASWFSLDEYRRAKAGTNLIMDSKALENLQLLEDEDRQMKHSLFGLLDRTTTSFGRRLFFTWVCHPLHCPVQVETRLRNVEYLISDSAIASDLATTLRKVKIDLERVLAKSCSERLSLKDLTSLIDTLQLVSTRYTLGWRNLITNDSSIPKSLVRLLETFHGDVPPSTGSKGSLSALELRSTLYPNIPIEPTAHQELEWLMSSFDRDSFAADSTFIPSNGVCEEYDEASIRLERVNEELKSVVAQVVSWYESSGGSGSVVGKSTLSMRSELDAIAIVDVGNAFRLLEIPQSLIKARGTPPFLLEVKARTTAKLGRFYTKEIEKMLPEWKEATLAVERSTSIALSFLSRRIASCSAIWWKPWTHALAELDCLLSLAFASQIDPERQCRPTIFALSSSAFQDESRSSIDLDIILPVVEKPFLHLKESLHPLLANGVGCKFFSTLNMDGMTSQTSNQTQIISNDLDLGYLPSQFLESASSSGQMAVDEDQNSSPYVVPGASIVLLTGPNMGGKSTILRQACLSVIMVQLGCYPFAKECSMTTVDRVFTRIGASDNIFEGRSTFMVELEEASAVLNEATERSIVILDELGRGTSTFDGYSLAFATLHHLALHTRCLTMFSTHYHLLTSEVETLTELREKISLYHMDALVDTSNHSVTFMYKMVPGVCPRSYGMMVAAMAQIPLESLQVARKKSIEFQATMQAQQLRSPYLRTKYLLLASLLRTLIEKTRWKQDVL